MSNFVYGLAKEGLLTAKFDLDVATFRAALVRDYTGNTTAMEEHEFLDDLTATGEVVATDDLTGVTWTQGVFDADDSVFATVAAGDPITSIIVYQHTLVDGSAATDATRRLFAHYDTASGLPYTPTGVDVTVVWSNFDYRIYAL